MMPTIYYYIKFIIIVHTFEFIIASKAKDKLYN